MLDQNCFGSATLCSYIFMYFSKLPTCAHDAIACGGAYRSSCIRSKAGRGKLSDMIPATTFSNRWRCGWLQRMRKLP